MNALFQGAVDVGKIDKQTAIAEINALIKWQGERKKWHQDKTRQKMAADSNSTPDGAPTPPGSATFRSSDFGLDAADVADMQDDDDSDEDEEEDELDDADPIAGERKRRAKQADRLRRAKQADRLRRTAGEPVKPNVTELAGMKEGFLAMLRMVLAD